MIQDPKRRTDHGIELAVVIGKMGMASRESGAEEYRGLCIGLRHHALGPEKQTLGKSIDTMLGPRASRSTS